MSGFIIRFEKTVLGDNGHERQICEDLFEVDAPGEEQAVEIAKQRFCALHSSSDWCIFADKIVVEASEPGSAKQ